MKLGIGIPYYKNSEECEIAFKKMFITVWKQVTEETRFIVYEDGQESEWLKGYSKGRTIILGSPINRGIACVRNLILTRLITSGCDYILFLDSDDMIDCDFIRKMYEAAETGNYDMIISKFIMNKKELITDKRCNVAGICLRTKFIEGLKFDEDYNISEDTLFINQVYDRNPKIFKIDSNYYYNYGINPNSLMMRFERSELKLKKGE